MFVRRLGHQSRVNVCSAPQAGVDILDVCLEAWSQLSLCTLLGLLSLVTRLGLGLVSTK